MLRVVAGGELRIGLYAVDRLARTGRHHDRPLLRGCQRRLQPGQQWHIDDDHGRLDDAQHMRQLRGREAEVDRHHNGSDALRPDGRVDELGPVEHQQRDAVTGTNACGIQRVGEIVCETVEFAPTDGSTLPPYGGALAELEGVSPQQVGPGDPANGTSGFIHRDGISRHGHLVSIFPARHGR